MKVHVYLRRRAVDGSVSEHVLAAAEGFRRHGIEPKLLEIGRPEPCDLAVVWGVRKKAEMASGRRSLVLERGYVADRFYWTSMAFDGLNGRADFCNQGMCGDRWNKHFAGEMKPWRGHGGDYVLVLGQVTGDASIAGLVNIYAWYEKVAAEIKRSNHLKVRYRRHPKEAKQKRLPTFTQLTGTLEEALAEAKWVVSFNSNSAVDAVLAGVPAVTIDKGAMAWPVSGRDPAVAPPMPDRTAWAHDLAWCQWKPEEIARGDAWDHLKIGMQREAAA